MDSTSVVSLFTGGMSLTFFVVFLAWAYMGVGVQMGLDVMKRKPDSENSPKEFSFKYYWHDNKFRILFTLGLMIVGILLYNETYGEDLSRSAAFAMGILGDGIVDAFNKKISK